MSTPKDIFEDEFPIEYPIPKAVLAQALQEREQARIDIAELSRESKSHHLDGLEVLQSAVDVHPDCGYLLLRKAVERFCNRLVERHDLRVSSNSRVDWVFTTESPNLDEVVIACDSILGRHNTQTLLEVKNSANNAIHGLTESIFSQGTIEGVGCSAKAFLHVLRDYRKKNPGD